MGNKNIIIELKGNLERFIGSSLGDKKFTISCANEFKIIDILKLLSIPKERIALVTINGKISSLEFNPNKGDRLVFYPPIGGG